MPKRLVVCCDGTWNRPDQLTDGVPSPTNVSKLSLGVLPEAGGTRQLLYYHRGVGSGDGRLEHLLGGVFGRGLSSHVRDCYGFLVEHHEPGDEVYLFGFSRGAYTARSTAGLVRNAGILRAEHADRIGEAYKLYRSRADPKHPGGVESQIFRRMYAHESAAIHCIGVWDTVGALGIPGLRGKLAGRLWGFHDTELSSQVRFAFQALAIDERRGPFEPTLWHRKGDAGDQVLEQVWFSGVHCDVGGGYADPALAEVALLWMVRRAQSCGLAVDPGAFEVKGAGADPERRQNGAEIAPDALGQIHDSRKSYYRALPPRPRTMADPGGTAPSTVASSAVRRRDELPGYAPKNLGGYLAGGGDVTVVQDGG